MMTAPNMVSKVDCYEEEEIVFDSNDTVSSSCHRRRHHHHQHKDDHHPTTDDDDDNGSQYTQKSSTSTVMDHHATCSDRFDGLDGTTTIGDHRSSTGHLTMAGGTSLSASKTPKERKQMQRTDTETKIIFRFKIFVLSFLLVSAICVAYLVYNYLHRVEVNMYHKDGDEFSNMIHHSIGLRLEVILGSMESMTTSMVSYAKATSQNRWPFVTIPDFAVRVAKLRTISNAIHISEELFVTNEQRAEWESYTYNNTNWMEESVKIQKEDNFIAPLNYTVADIGYNRSIVDARTYQPVPNASLYLPHWQTYPIIPNGTFINSNHLSPMFLSKVNVMIYEQQAILQAMLSPLQHLKFLQYLVPPDTNPNEPIGYISYPILSNAADMIRIPPLTTEDTMDDDNNNYVYNPGMMMDPNITLPTINTSTVGILSIVFSWRDLLEDILPNHIVGLVAVFNNACNQSFTYELNGSEAVFLGEGDLHDPHYKGINASTKLAQLTGSERYTGVPLNSGQCDFSFTLYSSKQFESTYLTNKPLASSFIAVGIFLFTSIIFLMYDGWVERRQRRVYRSALQSSAFISSLFPSNVRDRLFQNGSGDDDDDDDDDNNGTKGLGRIRWRKTARRLSFNSMTSIKGHLQQWYFENNRRDVDPKLTNNAKSSSSPRHDSITTLSTATRPNPIADLFPEATVLFADISGFTAWSSIRHPTQVFILLETVYTAFDQIADRRGVFKVETIGDSYVAVCGLPEVRADHAVVMAKFARDCRFAMCQVTMDLEITLGPDTGDLKMRFGLHSGPVTAGVLRGARTRFQLFGDTVNTASRIESNGLRDHIQVSQTTADLLTAAGKGSWLKKREDLIEAKGKGKLQCYWLKIEENKKGTESSGEPNEINLDENRTDRLIEWVVDIFGKLLVKVIARREALRRRNSKASLMSSGNSEKWADSDVNFLEEVKEVIDLPKFDVRTVPINEKTRITLSEVQKEELRDFVISVAALYNDNRFHCFEHAVHVTMSVVKLLSRIVTPDAVLDNYATKSPKELKEKKIALSLHDHTYGITSDPLTHLACVFSSLIHDAGHTGVPNSQVLKENTELSDKYKGKSVAEQNSIRLSWKLFMDDKYQNLRNAICETDQEMVRFRQLVVNSVMATDVMDRELNQLRNDKWEKAFNDPTSIDSQKIDQDNVVNRKATIVIEYIIQASDIAHTMQHWQVYRRWNERLFEEMYTAYRNGRSDTDPSINWYQNEIGFFDHYIIPLTKKLRDCGVFGVSSDEYMNYAIINREEWEMKGRDIVTTMIESLCAT